MVKSITDRQTHRETDYALDYIRIYGWLASALAGLLCVCYVLVLLQFAVKELKELEHQKQELHKVGNALIDFFCEDKDTMKLDECFQIFRDFCMKFNKAVKVRRKNTGSHSFKVNLGSP